MDPRELDDKIKHFVDNLADLEDAEQIVDAITNSVLNDQTNQGDDSSGDFKMGYNTGFVDGYQEGILISQNEIESTTYNQVIDDVINALTLCESNVDEAIQVINTLRK